MTLRQLCSTRTVKPMVVALVALSCALTATETRADSGIERGIVSIDTENGDGTHGFTGGFVVYKTANVAYIVTEENEIDSAKSVSVGFYTPDRDAESGRSSKITVMLREGMALLKVTCSPHTIQDVEPLTVSNSVPPPTPDGESVVAWTGNNNSTQLNGKLVSQGGRQPIFITEKYLNLPGATLISNNKVVGLTLADAPPPTGLEMLSNSTQYQLTVGSAAILDILHEHGLLVGWPPGFVHIASGPETGGYDGMGVVVHMDADGKGAWVLTSSNVVSGRQNLYVVLNDREYQAVPAVPVDLGDQLALLHARGRSILTGVNVIPVAPTVVLSKDDPVAVYGFPDRADPLATQNTKLVAPPTGDPQAQSGYGSIYLDRTNLPDSLRGAPVVKGGYIVGVVTSPVDGAGEAVSSATLSDAWSRNDDGQSGTDSPGIHGASTPLDLALANELRALNNQEGLDISVTWTDDDNAVSEGNTISLGRPMINRIKSLIGDDQEFIVIVQFVLAHEFAHRIQEHVYGSPAFNRMGIQQRELEADGIAGIWMFSPLLSASPNDLVPNSKINDDAQVARLALNDLSDKVLGGSNGAWFDPGVHGSSLERMVAFKNGEGECMAMMPCLYSLMQQREAVFRANHPGTGRLTPVYHWRLADMLAWSKLQAQKLINAGAQHDPLGYDHVADYLINGGMNGTQLSMPHALDDSISFSFTEN